MDIKNAGVRLETMSPFFFFLILPMLLTQVTLAASCLILSANLNRELPWSGLAHICATDTYWSILMQVSDK